MMIKKYLLAIPVISLMICLGCATGGNGVPRVSVSVTAPNIAVVGLNLKIQFIATVTGTTNTAVTWLVSGSGCTATPDACGTIDASGLYTAPSTLPSPASVTISAVSQADKTAKGEDPLPIVPLTVNIAPTPVNVGHGLVQQFAATVAPDNAPQTFTWACTQNGAPCANFSSNASSVAAYTAEESPCGNGCVTVSAVSSVNPTGCSVNPKNCTTGKVSVLASRLLTGSYAFRFAGFDNSNHPVAAAGTISVSSGAITAGVEDELTSGGPSQHAITGGSYTPSSANDNNSNNAGTLRLTTGAAVNQFLVVLDANGDFQLIETDGNGNGSGVMRKSATGQFNAAAQTFAFGFTGVDSNAHRVGYAGLLPLDGSGNITSGSLDANDNGSTSSLGCNQPCIVAGSYQYNQTTGLGQLVLTTTVTQHFDFFVSSGQTKNSPVPLTLYVISTDTIDSTHPAISGPMVYQFPMTYNNAAFAGTSVSNLTGANANISLTLGTTDGTSGSGGAGGFAGNFDQNNNGAVLSVATFTGYQYLATNGNSGRYTIQMLGDPTAKTVVPPLPFILYATGANRGFLLDQSSASVMTGSMDPQTASFFANTELPGTFALATANSSDPSVATVASNFMFTSAGNFPPTLSLSGTQNPGGHPLAATGVSISSTGVAPIALTAPATEKFVCYFIDLTDFYMIEVDSTKKTSLMFAQE